MKCVFCSCMQSRVVDSRQSEDGLTIRRRRECEKCGRRFTTYERIDMIPLMVVKKDETREPFQADKLRHGIIKACEKRPVSLEEIDALVCKATELGWQFGIHTIGDASEDRALHAFQEANKIRPVKELRHYLIHYQLPYEDQWPIMQELGVGVCLQPTLVSQMGEEPLFWPEQVERFQSPGLMFKNGIIAGGSSDSPVVSCDPMLGMYYAVTRLDETTGKTLSKGDESKVTPIQALIMWTKNSAFFSHDDDKMGSVEVGNLADFAILDRDCFASSDPTDIRDAKVTTTVLGGKVVYEA